MLTLGNPIAGSATLAVSSNQYDISVNGRSLSTGLKANNDVVSTYLGKSLDDKAFILGKIRDNMGYSSNALSVASSSLDSMAKTLRDMLAVVAQSTSDTNLDTLNDILQQKLKQVDLQVKSATFDNRPLLSGGLGQDSTIRSEYTNKAVSIKGALAAGNFAGLGTVAAATTGVYSTTLTTVVATNTVSIAGMTFTALANGTTRVAGSLTFQAGAGAGAPGDLFASTDLQVALNDIKTNGTVAQQLALKNYTITNATGIVTMTEIVPQGNASPVTLVSGTFTTAPADVASVMATGVSAQEKITVGTVVAGDLIRIEGVTFKAVAGDPVNPNEYSIGVSSNATTANLAKAIQTSKSETLQALTSSVAASVITLTRVSQGTADINVVNTSGNVYSFSSVRGLASGIDFSEIRTLDGFINVSTKPIFTLDEYRSGTSAKGLASSYGNVAAQATLPAVNAGDTAAVYSTVIGGRKFTGAFYEPNGVANLAALKLKMIDAESGESFTITAAAGAGDITTAANAATVLTNINTLFSTVNFNETQTLKVNTDKGDILVNNTPVASTTGTVVKLTAGDFTNMQFKDFIIEPGTAAGDVKFTAIITDKEGHDQSYTYNMAAASISSMIEGYKLDLTDSTGGTGNVLSINLGERGLSSLNLAANYAAVATAYKDMILNAGDGLEVRVGLNFEDVLKADIKDVSASKLYLNNAGVYVGTLSLDSDANRKVAQEVIGNALNKVRSEQTRVTSQIESIREASEALARTIQVTKEASDGYLKTDLIAAAQAFSEAVKKTVAAIATLEAGGKVADAAQRVIQSV